MKQFAPDSESDSHEGRQRAGKHRVRGQDAFDQQLDAVVQRWLERMSQRGCAPADEDYAMRWTIARFLRTQSRSAKGEDHVAA
jgi:hypothetical protein